MRFTDKAAAIKNKREKDFSKMSASRKAQVRNKMEKVWQDVFDRFPYGIYLVTISSPNGHDGTIALWVTQCSHEPSLIALAIRKNRLSHEQILETKKFCVNILPADATAMIKQFKIADWMHKFDACGYHLSANGLPVVDDCIGYVNCDLKQTINTGDHTLFIGRIISGGMVHPDKTGSLSKTPL